MIFFEILEHDHYFKTLFLSTPKRNIFEFHKMELDLQASRLRMNLHTSLLPEKTLQDKNNYSSISIDFFLPKNIIIKLNDSSIVEMYFKFYKEEKKIEARYGDDIAFTFEYSSVKLERWTTYLNDKS
jgi:hypothetical protein